MPKSPWYHLAELSKLPSLWPISARVRVNLPKSAHGRWQLMLLSGQGLSKKAWIGLNLRKEEDELEEKLFFSYGLKILTAIFYARMIYISGGIETADLEFYTDPFPLSAIRLRLFKLPRFLVPLVLICRRPSIIRFAFGGASGFLAGLRREMANVAISTRKPDTYADWTELYEYWPGSEKRIAEPVVVIVFKNGDKDRMALAATLAALKKTRLRLKIEILDCTAEADNHNLSNILNNTTEPYVAVLQAGEVINPRAINVLAQQMDERQLKAAYADEDLLDETGARHSPLFKPEPNLALMLSGSLTRGIWLFERSVLQRAVMRPGMQMLRWAETLRLRAWLLLDAEGQRHLTARLPMILTHRRPDMSFAPADELKTVVKEHLGPEWHGRIDASKLPLKICPGIGASPPKVALIIPSTARKPHVQNCLSSILANTSYPNFEAIIVVSQLEPLDAEQKAILQPLLTDSRVRLVQAQMQEFNYSTANNAGVAETNAPVICLLNDDIKPMNADWLNIMVGHLQDERVGIVGAKLYYENETVQHAGVIMGIDGVAAHCFHLLRRGDGGYADRAVLDQELSAVTGACLLVRRDVFDDVGGLDESFPIAFNDFEFCMQVRKLGYAIIWSAQAELFHFETLSLGHHYAGERAEVQDQEMRRFRTSWESICDDDPFYNPNLSLASVKQWTVTFLPRVFSDENSAAPNSENMKTRSAKTHNYESMFQ